jgi:hypothetical protein
LLFLINLDLNRTEEFLASFKRWIKLITDFISLYFTIVPSSTSSTSSTEMKLSLQSFWYEYIVRARENSGKKFVAEGSNPERKPADNYVEAYESLPFPLIIVGQYNPSMTFLSSLNAGTPANANDLVLLNKMKESVGKLRYYCLETGASIVFLSANLLNRSESLNDGLLKEYISHRLFPDQISMELSIEVSAVLELYSELYLSCLIFRRKG